MIKNAVIIGSGNVATLFARRLYQQGITIRQIMARNPVTGNELASSVRASCVTDWKGMTSEADCYIICVQDAVLPTVLSHLRAQPVNKAALILHTTGAASINCMEGISKYYGILYPLQSLRKEVDHDPEIPLFIDGNNTEAKEKTRKLATLISDQVAQADDAQRLKLHIAAVFVSNFPNYLYMLADQYCKEYQLPFSYLLPLMEETVSRLHTHAPEDMQTGPAMRGDHSTLSLHRKILEEQHPEMLEIYEMLTYKIRQHFQSGKE